MNFPYYYEKRKGSSVIEVFDNETRKKLTEITLHELLPTRNSKEVREIIAKKLNKTPSHDSLSIINPQLHKRESDKD